MSVRGQCRPTQQEQPDGSPRQPKRSSKESRGDAATSAHVGLGRGVPDFPTHPSHTQSP